jgi:hypothetical protein
MFQPIGICSGQRFLAEVLELGEELFDWIEMHGGK